MKIPKGFVILIDTREKQPLFQTKREGLVTISTKLDTGDYSLEGFKDKVCVELKRLSDFDSFIGRERVKKTIPKLQRMKEMDWSALVIEESEHKLFSKRKYGKMTPAHAKGFLAMVDVSFGISCYWSSNAGEVEDWILYRLVHVYKRLKGGKE